MSTRTLIVNFRQSGSTRSARRRRWRDVAGNGRTPHAGTRVRRRSVAGTEVPATGSVWSVAVVVGYG
jgi:hypothetical protein